MENYPSNSRSKPPAKKTAPPAKKVEKVVQGSVVRRKTPLGKKFRATFFPGDAKEVVRNVYHSVIIPAVKDLIWDAGQESLRRAVFKDEMPTRSRSSVSRVVGQAIGNVQYNRYPVSAFNAQHAPEPRREISRRGRMNHDFGEIILETRAEGNEVIEQLYAIVDQYEFATVKDLYDMLDIEGTPQDLKWGWTSMMGSDIRRLSDGTYLLELPRPEPID